MVLSASPPPPAEFTSTSLQNFSPEELTAVWKHVGVQMCDAAVREIQENCCWRRDVWVCQRCSCTRRRARRHKSSWARSWQEMWWSLLMCGLKATRSCNRIRTIWDALTLGPGPNIWMRAVFGIRFTKFYLFSHMVTFILLILRPFSYRQGRFLYLRYIYGSLWIYHQVKELSFSWCTGSDASITLPARHVMHHS